MKYIYTAVFTPNEDGTKIHARIPDLPGCVTTGHDLQDAIDQITDAASGWLVVAEDEELPIPAASKQAEIAHGALDTLSMVCVDTAAYRTQTGTQADLLSALSALSANMSDERPSLCRHRRRHCPCHHVQANRFRPDTEGIRGPAGKVPGPGLQVGKRRLQLHPEISGRDRTEAGHEAGCPPAAEQLRLIKIFCHRRQNTKPFS